MSKRPSPFEIAREALGHVGKFQTPPTPSVYEVWYRYVEGVDDIISNLSHAVENVNAVSVDMLEQLHKQYCVHIEDAREEVSDNLSSEIASLQSVIENQLNVGRRFGSEIDEACVSLRDETPTAQSVADCAKKMLSSNEAMQQQVQQLHEQLQASRSKVEYLQSELSESQKTIMTDPLTGLGNRRHFDLHVRRALLSIKSNGAASFLMLLDLDQFKYINDTFGHDSGDKVITHVATHLADLCSHAEVSRLGGDEFAIILPVDDYAEATDLAAEIRLYFASTPLKLIATGQDIGKVKVSIGGARVRNDDDAASWFIRADKLLYQAKSTGGNSVMLEHMR